MSEHEPTVEATEPRVENITIRIDGTLFRCICGANVFRRAGPERYLCNGCNGLYHSEPVAP